MRIVFKYFREQHRSRRTVRKGFPGQFDIVVHGHLCVTEADLVTIVFIGYVDHVVTAGNQFKRNAGVDLRRECHLVIA